MQEQHETPPVATSRHGWKSLLSLGLAALTCPCHLPLVIGLLAGTTIGAWMSQHSGVVTLVMFGVFVISLLYGLRTFSSQRSAADTTNSTTRSFSNRETEPSKAGVGQDNGYSTLKSQE